MTNFNPLYSATHQINDGIITVATPFTGNTLFVEVDFNTLLDRSDIDLGILYVYSGDVSTAYRLNLKQTIISLPVSSISKIRFLPTLDIYSDYSLTLKYATVGSVIDNPNAYPLPEQITGLPNRVDVLEGIAIEHSSRLDTLEENQENMVAPNWETLSGKPTSFPPIAHSHSISNIDGLASSLSSIETEIDGIALSVGSISSRVASLEASTASNSNKNVLEKFRDIVTTPLDFFYADIKALALDFISESNLSTQNGVPNRTYRNGLTGILSQGGSNAHYFLNHNSLLDISGDMTYLAIVRTGSIPSGNPANLQGVLCKQTDSANGHSLFITGNKLNCEFTNNSGTTFSVESADTLQSNTDYLMRVYRSGSTIGVQIGTSPKTESNTFTGTLAIQSSAPVRLGNKVSSTFGFQGVIYLAAICDGIISDDQWSSLNTNYLNVLK